MSDILNQPVQDAVKEVVVSQFTGKKWYTSKTFWVNVIAGAALIAQSKFGFIVDPEIQAVAITVINLALRKITKESIVW